MSTLDRATLPDDPELDSLISRMEDGGFDDWVNVSVITLNKYVTYRVLEALEELEERSKKEDAPDMKKILDNRILRIYKALNPLGDQL